MSFVPEQEAQNFDSQVTAFWSHVIQRDVTSPLFFQPLKLGGLGVGSAVQRHVAAPWRAWQSHPNTHGDTPFNTAPRLRAHNFKPHSHYKLTNQPSSSNHLEQSFAKKATEKKRVTTIQRHFLQQLLESLTTSPVVRAVLLSQSTSHTGAHLMQPSSEACEAEDRCFRVAVGRRLMLPYPAAPNAADVAQTCPNKIAAGQICSKPVDPQQHHCYGCWYGGGVDRRHAALARCLADVIHSHSGTKVFIKQEVRALTRVVNVQREHARMDLVFNLYGSVTYPDVSIVAPFSCNPSLVAAANTRPGHTAKRAEKSKFDRYPHVNLVPFILVTTGRPGQHARKFIRTPGQPSRACSTAPSPNNNSQLPLRDPQDDFCRTFFSFLAVPRYVKC